MNAQLHIDGSFQAMRQALDEANREFANTGADRHGDALQHLGRVVMNSIAAIIETDGGTHGYLYDADGIAQILRLAITSCLHRKRPPSLTSRRNNQLTERGTLVSRG